MGQPKKPKKKYATPKHPWKEDRIKSERELMKKYGLKNHREIWKAKTYLGKYRKQARVLLAQTATGGEQVKRETGQLLMHLSRMGILKAGSGLDDVLALETEIVLSRRLQTLVYLKGLSSTPDQARQLINHGHVAVNNKKVTIPSYMVPKDEENNISYTFSSPLNELSHPARPKADAYSKPTVSESPTPAAPAPKQDKKPAEKPKEQKKPTQEPPKEDKKPANPPAQQPKPAEQKTAAPTEEQPTKPEGGN